MADKLGPEVRLIEFGRLLELRVLAGPQRGCRLPLHHGLYRAGGSADCDLLIELPAQQAGFILYVGEQALALESLTADLEIGGHAIRGMHALSIGEHFLLGEQTFAVDYADAAWQKADANTAETDASPMPLASQLEAEQTIAASDAAMLNTADADLPPPLAVSRRRPWSVLRWFTLAAICLGTGCTAIMLVAPGKSPAQKPSAAPATPTTAAALSAAIRAANDNAELTLTPLAGKQWRVSGYIRSAKQLGELTRRLRQIEPTIRIAVNADDTLEALARETLGRLNQAEIEVDELRLGKLTLRGRIATADKLHHISTALAEDLPNLAAVRTDGVNCADRAKEVLQDLIDHAGLQPSLRLQQSQLMLSVDGKLALAQQALWRDVRAQFEARFGTTFHIDERLRLDQAPASDIVLRVGGGTPFVLLRNGDKMAGLTAD